MLGDSEDFLAQIEAHNEEVDEAIVERGREGIREAGERLHWALDIGPGQHSPGGQISLGTKRVRTRFK